MKTYTVQLLLSSNNPLKVDVKANSKLHACAKVTTKFKSKNEVVYVQYVKEKYKVLKIISIALLVYALTYPIIF